jgi:hypothetical protein
MHSGGRRLVVSKGGAALIEVLVALVIFSVAGLTLVEYVTSVERAQLTQLDRERELLRAERLLTATILLNDEELSQRLGMRRVGDFMVWVDRPEPFLFRVGVSRAARPERELLSTFVYRRRELPQ